ncbi:retrotransposon protein, putative, ty1-copia subclass [Tanacetum coccineum]
MRQINGLDLQHLTGQDSKRILNSKSEISLEHCYWLNVVVLESRDGLRYHTDLYIEGTDQHRGESSLAVKSTVVVPAHMAPERNLSTTTLMETCCCCLGAAPVSDASSWFDSSSLRCCENLSLAVCYNLFPNNDHMDTLPSENTSKIPVEPDSLGPSPKLIPVHRSERTTRAPNRLCLNMEVEDDVVGDLGEPANYKAAMLDPDKVIWQGAMDEEMNSMKVNEVWIEVDPPSNAKVVRSKWLFKKKTDMDGEVHTYKARLVAKGCTQTYGIDYEETFSPVADIRAIRILIAIAAYYDYEIWQMDVKTAFLNGRLDEDIYMEQPEGYVNPKYPNRVCKLQRSIYGLKQASRQWNKRFDEEIKKFGFTQNRDEPCVYRKASGSNVVFLILYVDDILIMGNNIPRLKEVKDYLGKCFSMKDLGEAAYILGIKIYRDRSKRLIGLSQSAYIDKILKKFNMHNSKKGYLPMEVKHELSNEMCASTPEEVAYMKKVPYASAVGSIMYAVRCTRPDVAFAQNLEYERYVFSVWIRKFFGDLGVMPSIKEPINMYCDNSAAIIFANDSGVMKGARHFLRRYHYVREQVESGEIKILKVHTDDNLADPFTKALPRGKVTDLANGIGLQLASSFMHTCD